MTFVVNGNGNLQYERWSRLEPDNEGRGWISSVKLIVGCYEYRLWLYTVVLKRNYLMIEKRSDLKNKEIRSYFVSFGNGYSLLFTTYLYSRRGRRPL